MELRARLEGIDLNAAVVSAIVERERAGEIEVLVQIRWKPDSDPEYSGTLEIPAGGIHAYEDVYEAVRREVLEETGLRVTSFHPDIRSRTYAPRDDDCFAFVPFCCQQQLKGGIPRVGFVFVGRVADGDSAPQREKVRDIRWMKKSELRTIIGETPENVFTLQLGVLDYYLNHDQTRSEAGHVRTIAPRARGMAALRRQHLRLRAVADVRDDPTTRTPAAIGPHRRHAR